MIKIVESPREGMQGVERFIPTASKIRFVDQLLKVGFHTVEVGSIVNPKIVPQMVDTLKVIRKMDYSASRSERMVLVMSKRGATEVGGMDEITTVSYPFSFSPSFLLNNMHATLDQALLTSDEVVNTCLKHGKKAVVYISYAFGNPYGDPWSIDILLDWIGKLRKMGIRVIPLSNVSLEIDAGLITRVFSILIREFPDIEFGLHLHTGSKDCIQKIDAAYASGCRRFDTVINGYGGCPLSGQELMGNLSTQNLHSFLDRKRIPHGLDPEALREAATIANEIY